jgi:hypothetical protein
MTFSNPSSTTANSIRSSSRKKPSSKQDESEKITEKMEGGIIVRRYKGKKINIEP